MSLGTVDRFHERPFAIISEAVDPLRPLIDLSRTLPGVFDELKRDLGPPLIAWDDFPVATLNKLEACARVDLFSGLTLLEKPSEAYGAEVHVRTLIELLANVAWITGFDRYPPDLPEARQRAICLELGVADQVRRSVDKTPKRFHMGQDTNKGANQRFRAYNKLHAATGCQCGGRRWHQVQDSLEQLIESSKEVLSLLGRSPDQNQFEQYRYLYSTASAVSHLGFWDRMLQPVDVGITDFVPASFQHRGNLLSWIAHTYGTSCIWMLELQRSERVPEMAACISAVLGDPVLRQAGAGDLDEKAPAV